MDNTQSRVYDTQGGNDNAMSEDENEATLDASILLEQIFCKYKKKINLESIYEDKTYFEKVMVVPWEMSEKAVEEKLGKLDLNNFTSLFMIDVRQEETETVRKALEKFTGIKRTFIIRFQSANGEFYYKNISEETFVKYDGKSGGFDINLEKFMQSIQSQFSDEFIDQLMKNKDTLIIRLMLLIENEIFFAKLVAAIIKRGTFDQLLALLNLPFNYQNQIIDSPYLLSKVFSDGSSILKSALEDNKIEIVSLILDHRNLVDAVNNLPFNHKTEIAKLKEKDEKMLLKLMKNIDIPFPDSDEDGYDPERPLMSVDSKEFAEARNNFQDSFKTKDTKEEVKKLAEKRNNFHNAIKADDMKEVKKLAKKFDYTKAALNSNNESALFTALKNRKFKVYAYLKTMGFIPRSADEEKEEKEKLTKEENEELVKENVKQSVENADNSLMSLLGKCRVKRHHDVKTDPQKLHNVVLHDIFKELFDTQYCGTSEIFKPALEIVAKLKDFCILFHFGYHSINEIDPKLNDSTNGLYVPRRRAIYIAADKAATDSSDRQMVKGVVMHEIYHCVFNTVFENKSKPYYSNDNGTSEDLKKIVDLYKRWSYVDLNQFPNFDFGSLQPKDHCDGIVMTVYTHYKRPACHDLELVVRPAEIIASYNSDKAEQLGKEYKELFDFFFKTLPKLEDFNQTMKIRENVKEMNRIIGFLPLIKSCGLRLQTKPLDTSMKSDIMVLKSDVPFLTLIYLHQILKNEYPESTNIFLKSKTLRNEEIFNRIKSIMSESEQITENKQSSGHSATENFDVPRLIIYVTEDFEASLRNRQLAECLKRAIFVVDRNNTESIEKFINNACEQHEISHTFKDLDDNSQRDILKRIVKFQGQDVKLGELLTHKEAQETIDAQQLDQLCNQKCIEINTSQLFNPRNNENFKYFASIYQSRQLVRKTKEDNLRTMSKEDFEKVDKSKFKSFKENTNEGIVTVTEEEIKRETLSQSQLIDDTRHQPIVLISDISGNGKSWLLADIASKMVKNYPSKWMIFAKLSDFEKDFTAVNDEMHFESFLSQCCLGNKNFSEQEINIFKCMYNGGKCVILLDGLDEVQQIHQEKVMRLLKSFDKTRGNQLWVASRDHLEGELRESLDLQSSYSLETMSDDQCIKLLKELIESREKEQNLRGINFGASTSQTNGEANRKQKLDSSDHHEKAESLFNRLKDINHKSTIGLPQLITVVAEIYDDFGTDQTDEITNYLIYNKLKLKFKRDWLIKHPSSHEIDGFDFSEAHQFFVMQRYFPGSTEFCDLTKLDSWTEEIINSCGIAKLSNNYIKFHHETFQEYFVAEFFMRLIANSRWKKYDDFFQHFEYVLEELNFKVVRSFINDGLTMEIIRKIDDEEFVAKFKDSVEGDLWIKAFRAIYSDCDKILEFLLRVLKTSPPEEQKTFFYEYGIFNVERFINPGGRVKCWKKLLGFIKDFERVTFDELFVSRNALHELLEHAQCAEMISEFATLMKEKIKEDGMIPVLNIKHGWGKFLECVFESKNSDFGNLKVAWEIFRKCIKGYENIKKFLLRIDFHDKTVLHKAAYHGNPEMFAELYKRCGEVLSPEDMSKFIRMEDNGCNFLFISSSSRNKKFHETIWELIKNRNDLYDFLRETNNHGNNFFHELLSSNSDVDVIKLVYENLSSHLDEVEFLKFLHTGGYKNRHLLHNTIIKQQDNSVLQLVWDITKSMSQNLINVLKRDDNDSDNIFLITAGFSTKKKFMFLVDAIERDENLKKEIKNLLLTKNKEYNGNILHKALTKNQPVEYLEYLWDLCRKNFSDSELKNFIGLNNWNYIHLFKETVKHGNFESFDFIFGKIYNLLNPSERKQYFNDIREDASENDTGDRERIVDRYNQLLGTDY